MNRANSLKSDITILLKEITDFRIRMLICTGFCNKNKGCTSNTNAALIVRIRVKLPQLFVVTGFIHINLCDNTPVLCEYVANTRHPIIRFSSIRVVNQTLV